VQLAAEAICTMSGLDLQRAKLVRVPDEQEETDALSADGIRATRLLGPDDRLPLPDVAGVDAWWARERARFAPGVRYLGGRPFTLTRLHDALEHGPTRRRHAFALELSARSAGACRLQTRAFTRAQREQSAAFATLAPSALRESARVLAVPPLSEA
jgi:uncharacterized protein (TIGR02270 family)